MYTKKRTWSFKTSILISCIACMVLVMLLQLVLFTMSSSSVISEQTAQINRRTLENLSDDVYDRLKRIENSLITIYEHKSFVRELAGLQDADALSQQMAHWPMKWLEMPLIRTRIWWRCISHDGSQPCELLSPCADADLYLSCGHL